MLRKKEGNYAENTAGVNILPAPFCKLFQIHGSKFKLHPVRNLSQACVSGIAQTVFLFGICKNTLYRFFSCFVHPLVDRCVPGIVSQFLILLPDVSCNRLNAVFILGAKVSGRTVATDLWITFILSVSVPVGSAVVQCLVLRTDNAVEMLVVNILPPFMSALHGLRPLVGCGQNSVIPEHLLTDMRGLIGTVRYESMDLWKLFHHLVINIIKSYTVMYIAGGDFHCQNNTVDITGSVGFIGQLPLVVPLYEQTAFGGR